MKNKILDYLINNKEVVAKTSGNIAGLAAMGIVVGLGTLMFNFNKKKLVKIELADDESDLFTIEEINTGTIVRDKLKAIKGGNINA